MKRLFILSLIVFVGTILVNAQQEEVDLLEKEINSVALKTYNACVKILSFDTETKQIEPGGFSGVVVSKEGHVLTAAHAVDIDKTYIISFPNGMKVLTETLGKIDVEKPGNVKYDLAMLKIAQKGDWAYAEMGWSNSLNVNDIVIGISYTGNLNQDLPTLRFGRISQVAAGEEQIISTCKMEPGDSGGPLFDRYGRVIAVHSSVLRDINYNIENPIDLYRKYWDALNVHANYDDLPEVTNEIGTDTLFNSLSQTQTSSNESDMSITLKAGTSVNISSIVQGRKTNIIGTVFLTESSTFIVSKSSMVGSNPEVIHQDISLILDVKKRDPDNDLVLLKLAGKLKNGIQLSSIKEEPKNLDMHTLGKIMVTALPNEGKIGVLGSKYLSLPRLFSSGAISLDVKEEDYKLLIRKIVQNSTVAKAGLLEGDQIISINDKEMNTIEDIREEIILHDPGDEVEFGFLREDNKLSAKVVLTPRPISSHSGEQFAGGRSIRSDGFQKVFVHDAEILASQCGSPVFDIHGDFYGINISRFSRATTLVMPADIVLDFIKPYL